MVGDGLGGAIMVWADERGQEAATPRALTDTFGQRWMASGREAWTPAARGNHPIAAGPGYQMNPHVLSDGRGGALLTWNEFGPFAAVSGRVQRLDSQGRVAPGWPVSGVALGLEVASLAPDLDGGALAVWIDSTGSYLQHFESRWSPQGGVSAPLSLGPAGRSNVRISSDRRGGAFMAREERGEATTPGGAELKVRIQHLSLESGMASPIVQLPTHDTPTIAFAVHPVAPNPARQSCRVAFDLPTADHVTIDVFDVAGRRIARLTDHLFEAGSQSVSWDLSDRRGRRVPAGLYLLRVVAGVNHAVVRVTIMG
jgi:hypothetical protein